jgi:hypothetical protein
MQFMVSVVLNPGKAATPPPKELVEAEFEAIRGHYMNGMVRQIWLRADGSGGIILAEADTAETVEQTFAALPMVRAGVLAAPEIVPLAPYWGFAPRG